MQISDSEQQPLTEQPLEAFSRLSHQKWRRHSPPAHPGLVTLKSPGDSVHFPQQSTILHVNKNLTGAPNGHEQLILSLIVLEEIRELIKNSVV